MSWRADSHLRALQKVAEMAEHCADLVEGRGPYCHDPDCGGKVHDVCPGPAPTTVINSARRAREALDDLLLDLTACYAREARR